MYFTKLASNFFLEYQTNLEKEEFANFGNSIDGNFYGISYNRIEKTYSEMLLNFLPDELKEYFSPGVMKINTPSYVRPHIDNDVCTAINFYVNTADATTVYYEFKTDNPKEIKIKNQTSGSIYQLQDLHASASFHAKPGEVWMLDVSKPHAVFPKTKENRIAFCLHSNILPYQEAKDLFIKYRGESG